VKRLSSNLLLKRLGCVACQISTKSSGERAGACTFLLDEVDAATDPVETRRGVIVLLALAEISGPSESVPEASSTCARALEGSSFFNTTLGRESAGSGSDGISERMVEGEACGSGLKVLGDLWATRSGDAVCAGVFAERVLSVDGVSSALAVTLLPWLRSLTTPCSSTADLFGNLNGEGESIAAPWEPGWSGLPSFIVEDAIASGRLSRSES